MDPARSLKLVTDEELLRRLAEILRESRGTEADLVAHIGEVDARRLYAREASPSMFAYCTERLHLSEAEAYLRIAAARASRENPPLLAMLADGRLHLTAIAKLAPHLTPQNRDGLLQRATHKTKREVEELIAEVAPRPDASALMRKLPERRSPALVTPALRQPLADIPRSLLTLRPDGVDAAGQPPTADCEATAVAKLRPDRVGSPQADIRPAAATASAPMGAIQPLAPGRYKVQFTASSGLRDKLERLKALMRSSVPDGDLAAIVEAAVTEKLERLEARRFARTNAPRKGLSKSQTKPASRHVPAAVRRFVHERDGGRCRFVDEQGRRCTARDGLEFHHRHPFALGGDHSPDGLSLLCRTHNQHLAEVDYGRGAIARHRRPSAGPPGPPETT
jgi:hypothetical protein